ncbi:receptor-like protein Cf-9 [Pistacia vera]|uniref:receptor-like protein Cf-9 n=1 Tax=Pistacia vera TaxID=55513 RepID=UPI001263A2E2|nr:receptor-like protein Cf-9 [Pistacia vera]
MTPSSNFFSFMHLLLLFSLFNLIVLAHFTSFVQTLCHDDERSSLLRFKESLVINKFASFDPLAYSKVALWKADEDCCSWDGVTCNEVTGHLIRLNLTSSCLYGYIHSTSTLFQLAHLEWLSLADNHFNGSKIPSRIMNLSRLTFLNLSYSAFSGQIPSEFLKLSNLETLDTSLNRNLELQEPGLKSLVDKLTHLKVLNLSQVNISSSVPDILANLSSLTELSSRIVNCKESFLQRYSNYPTFTFSVCRTIKASLGTSFSGEVPYSIGNLNSLILLDIHDCSFSGSIPSSLGNLTKITNLYLSGNQFSGKLSTLFGNPSSLEELDLSYNFSSQDSRALSWMTKYSKLTYLGLSQINLFGEIPSWLMNLTHLTHLYMSQNELKGPIPYWLMNLSQLVELSLSSNRLIGNIPSQVGNLTQLQLLALGSNMLQGAFPIALYDLENLRVLDLISTNLNSTLELLDLSHNNLSGKLPQCLGNFSHFLELLSLKNNNFSGGIPENFLNGENLRMIDLSQNQLHGKIPRSLANCRNLEFLDLGNNQINDTFPSWLETLPNLKVLILQSNRLRGAIKEPETAYAFPELQIIDLSHNRFTGSLPSKYFESWDAMKVVNGSSLTYMQALKTSGSLYTGIDETYDILPSIYDYSMQLSTKGIELEYGRISYLLTAIIFSSNKFEGHIPASIANLRGLHFLVLSNNNLKGSIPPSMANLTILESLDLSNNKLSGQIPQQLEDLTFLSYFNVSNNHLTGRIPQGKQFDTFESISFDGNPGLCGKQIAKKCGDFPPSKKEEDPAGSKFPLEFGWKIVLTGFASGIIAGVALEHAFSPRIKVLFMKIFERKLMNTFGRQRAHRSTM